MGEKAGKDAVERGLGDVMRAVEEQLVIRGFKVTALGVSPAYSSEGHSTEAEVRASWLTTVHVSLRACGATPVAAMNQLFSGLWILTQAPRDSEEEIQSE